MYPEHFLPHGAGLPIYNPATGTWKTYVASRDRRLRESAEPDSARLPPFRHPRSRLHRRDVNIFLVAINADIKFRRYFEMIQHPPTTPLPDDVLALMRHVVELVDLLYWEPVPAKGSVGEALQAERSLQHKNTERVAKASQLPYTEMASGEESPPGLTQASKSLGCHRQIWRSLASTEERKAYATTLMCGHGIYSLPLILAICGC